MYCVLKIMLSISIGVLSLILFAANVLADSPYGVPTYSCIGLYWDGVGGEGIDCTAEYRADGETDWKRAQNLWYDTRPSGDWHGGEYRGSIVGLNPETAYHVRLRLSSGEEEIISVTTWTEVENLPVAETVIVRSQKSGYVIDKGGSQMGYIVYDGTSAEISGGSEPGVSIGASYVILRNLTVTDVGKYGIELGNVHDVVIDNCDISVWGTSRKENLQTEDDCGIWSNACGLARITVQNCDIHHPRYTSNSWDTGHPLGANGIAFECEGFPEANHVIRNNRIFSDTEHMFNDGMGADHNFSYDGFPIRDSDIYGNTVTHVWDDGIEVEGANMNVRVWDNHIDLSNIAFGLATTSVGPLYVFRNTSRWMQAKIAYKYGWSLFKLGLDESEKNSQWYKGKIYIYHNSSYQPHGVDCGIQPSTNAKRQYNVTSRNNVLHVRRTSIRPDAAETMPLSDFDYDLYNGSIPEGHEAHGIEGIPLYIVGTDKLRTDSPGHDDGLILYNFNDKNSAWPFYGAGPDMGAVETKE